MADLDHLRWIKDYEKESKQPRLMHTINPPAGWTNDSECYYLMMELPDFKQDQVEVKVDPLGNLIIKGVRQSGDNEHVKFERHFKLPEDSDMTKPVSRKFQNDMLYITVSRQLVRATNKFEFESASKEEQEMRGEVENMEAKPESKEGNGDEKKANDERKKENNVPKGILKKLDEHRCIWFGILAFALGVLGNKCTNAMSCTVEKPYNDDEGSRRFYA
ncbi:hypothetical protein V2J09_014973 [Rumex salicifolius]